MRKDDIADEQDAPVTPTGWTPEQMEKLSPALADRIARAVRAAESDGMQLRCGSPPRVAGAVSVIVLSERGEATRMKGDDNIAMPLCEAASAHLVAVGLAVRSVGEYSLGVSVQPVAVHTEGSERDEASESKEAPATRRRGTVAR